MADRVVAFMATVFRRSDHEITVEDPMSPVGGDYLNPTPTNAFWSKTFPPGDLPLYASTRIFTSDGLFPQEADWNPPVLILKHGEKGDIGLTGGSGVDGTNGLGGAPGAAGTPGSPGAAGTSIVWLGEAAAHPVNAVNGHAYKNTTNRYSYTFYNGAWYQMTIDGMDGQAGYNNAIVSLYRKNTSTSVPPTSFSGTFTYTFATALLAGGALNGWSQTLPSASPGEYVWVRQATAVTTDATDTIESAEFSAAVVISGIGTNGLDGLDGTSVTLKGSVALVGDLPLGATAGDLYVVLADGNGYVSDGANNWASVGAIQGPAGQQGLSIQVSYHNASAAGAAPALPTNATGTNNGWYTEITASANWMTVKVDDGTGTIWGVPIKITGVDGLNNASIYLYKKSTSNITPPAVPTGTFTYTFASGVLSGGVLNGWTQAVQTLAKGEYLWLIQATASSLSTTDSILATEFSAGVVTSAAGVDGFSIVWKGELDQAPGSPITNWAYKNTNNNIVYIYNGIAWEVMVLDGSDGTNGTNGTNGLSVYITYHDNPASGVAPTLPTTAAGTNNGWHTAATSASNWMSQKVDNGLGTAWGAAIKIKGVDGSPGQDLTYDLTVPPTPVGLAAVSYYAKIGLTWTASASSIHSHTEIWRSTTDDLATATYVESSTSAQYMDSPPTLVTGTTYFYWIRFASTSRVYGLFNAVAGVAGSVANDPTYMLELLAGKLDYGQFDVANGIFPIRTVTALPTLPNTAWPNNSMAYLTTNNLLYKVVAGAFVVEPDQAASRAQFGVGALAAGAVLAQSVGANEIIANSANLKDGIIQSAKIESVIADKVTAGTITGSTLQTAATGKRFVVDSASNEAHFYGDRGDGTIEELATIGINAAGSDVIIGKFGGITSGFTNIGLLGQSYSSYGIRGDSINFWGIYGYSLNSTGVSAYSGFGVGLHAVGATADIHAAGSGIFRTTVFSSTRKLPKVSLSQEGDSGYLKRPTDTQLVYLNINASTGVKTWVYAVDHSAVAAATYVTPE